MTAGAAGGRRQSALWAVTSYFNPAGYRRRLANYRLFRERLAAPLLTIEMATNGDFALNDDDADLLVRCPDGDVMWQKERLLNHAFSFLPPSCRYVAWIDCDILFTSDDWIDAAPALLDRHRLLQLFSEVTHAPPDAAFGPPRSEAGWMRQPSIARAIAEGQPLETCVRGLMLRASGTVTPGMAWAARRELIETCRLFDASIVGGGDTALVCAVVGRPDLAMDVHHMNRRQRFLYQRWADGFPDGDTGVVGCLAGEVVHLWHGDLAARRATARHRDLAPYDFDPARDIMVSDRGAWKWATDKPALHAYLERYFGARQEDGPPAAARGL